jgi:hypothetical protein
VRVKWLPRHASLLLCPHALVWALAARHVLVLLPSVLHSSSVTRGRMLDTQIRQLSQAQWWPCPDQPQGLGRPGRPHC